MDWFSVCQRLLDIVCLQFILNFIVCTQKRSICNSANGLTVQSPCNLLSFVERQRERKRGDFQVWGKNDDNKSLYMNKDKQQNTWKCVGSLKNVRIKAKEYYNDGSFRYMRKKKLESKKSESDALPPNIQSISSWRTISLFHSFE